MPMTPQEEQALRSAIRSRSSQTAPPTQEPASFASPEERLADLKRRATARATVPEAPAEGFSAEVGERFAGRREDVRDVLADLRSGESSTIEIPFSDISFKDPTAVTAISDTILRVGAAAGGVAVDIFAEAVESTTESAWEAIGEENQELLGEAGQLLLESDAGQLGIKALKKGGEMWEGYKERNPQTAKRIAAAAGIVEAAFLVNPTRSVLKKGTALAKKPFSKIGSIVAPVSDDAIFKAVKPRIVKGRNLKKVKEHLRNANTEIVEQGFSPTNLKEYVESIASSKSNLWSDIEQRLRAAGVDTTVDFKSISDEILKMSEAPALQRANPTAVKELEDLAESLLVGGERASVLEAEKVKQIFNAELEGLFGKMNLSQPVKEAKKMANREIGDQLDFLLEEAGERGFKELKTSYGSLKEIEDDVIKRMIVFERQNPEGLFSGLGKLAGAGSVTRGILSGSLPQIGQGISEIAISQLLKQANDVDKLIEKGFRQISDELIGKTR